jgi:hypothetical protein
MGEIFEGDLEKQVLLQEFLGYVLMPTCCFEKALFMYGTGANGKSTVIKILEVIIGKNNISHLTLRGPLQPVSNRLSKGEDGQYGCGGGYHRPRRH